MPLTPSVLFDLPQSEIASLITERMARSSAISMVTGFATPGGVAAVSGPIKNQPERLRTLVVGAATYPGFEALDDLLAAGVPQDHRNAGDITRAINLAAVDRQTERKLGEWARNQTKFTRLLTASCCALARANMRH